MKSEYIEKLRGAIRGLHGCDATHLETVPVHEVFKGQTVWKGDVEAFALHGHEKATRAYAWAYDDNGKPRYIAVLELPPVESAVTAVRAAIASGAQK